MKPSNLPCIGLVLLISNMPVLARDAGLHYKFSPDTTNVFAVGISVRSEAGSEVTTGLVFMAIKEVTTNSAKISWRTTFKTENRRAPQRGFGFAPNYYPGGMMPNVFPNDCEIELNDQGVELRDGGDYVMAVPLGKLAQALFEPLPAKSGGDESSDNAGVLDDPLWLGPADSFLNARINGQPIGMRYGMGFQQSGPATLLVSRHISTRAKNSVADLLEWHRTIVLRSYAQNNSEPRLTATKESDFTFDRKLGLLTSVEIQGDVSSQTEASSRQAKVVFNAHLIAGAELAAALAPPPPPAPRKLSGAELEKVTADLQAGDLETRRAAIRQMNGADIESPTDTFTALVGVMALDSDSFVQMAAANYLGAHATTNEVPILIKMLKNSDWPSRQNATKALGRLKDERAIQPLADLLARGSNNFGQDTSAALMNFGVAAEKAVIALLNEHNAETQRQACNILQQIGTAESVEPLQKLVGDSDQQTSQAAADAIRAIKQRL